MKTTRIVVIDDSPSSHSLYQRSIEPLDVELRAFLSPDDSLEFLARNGADLVFLDILMRDRDGLVVLKELRGMAHHGDTGVVVVTSKDYHQDRLAAQVLGALEFLVKPLPSRELRKVICRHTGVKPSVASASAI